MSKLAEVQKLQEEMTALEAQKVTLQDAILSYRDKPEDVQTKSSDREMAYNYAEIDRINSELRLKNTQATNIELLSQERKPDPNSELDDMQVALGLFAKDHSGKQMTPEQRDTYFNVKLPATTSSGAPVPFASGSRNVFRIPGHFATTLTAGTEAAEAVPTGIVGPQWSPEECRGLFSACAVLRTPVGNHEKIILLDPNAVSGTILRAEGTAPGEYTAPTLPAATFYESLATSGEMPVTVQALRNTALNMGMVITRLGANAVRNVSDEEITNGSTGNNPATVGHPFPITKQVKTGATTTAGVVSGKWVVTSGDVEEWINALDDRYLTVANAHNSGGRPHVGMMFSKLGRDSVRWIKNTASGDYYWQDNWRVGMPSTFMGYPIVMTDHLPAAATKHTCLLYTSPSPRD